MGLMDPDSDFSKANPLAGAKVRVSKIATQADSYGRVII